MLLKHIPLWIRIDLTLQCSDRIIKDLNWIKRNLKGHKYIQVQIKYSIIDWSSKVIDLPVKIQSLMTEPAQIDLLHVAFKSILYSLFGAGWLGLAQLIAV